MVHDTEYLGLFNGPYLLKTRERTGHGSGWQLSTDSGMELRERVDRWLAGEFLSLHILAGVLRLE